MEINYKYFAFNGVILLIIGLGMLHLIKHAFTEEVTAPCSERYATYMRFPESVGLGPKIGDDNIELHLDEEIQGLSNFTRVIYPNGNAPAVALQVTLPKGSLDPRKPGGRMGGMAFAWRPEIPGRVQSACLTYKLWLPKDFNFAKGGTLPGLFGGSSPGLDGYDQSESGFSTNVLWRENGLTSLRSYRSTLQSREGRKTPLGYGTLPKGRWVEISQEVVLNSAGQNDGTLRVWIDGELRHEAEDVVFRKAEKLQFTGVLGDVFYGVNRRDPAAPKDTFLRITPFVLNWN